MFRKLVTACAKVFLVCAAAIAAGAAQVGAQAPTAPQPKGQAEARLEQIEADLKTFARAVLGEPRNWPKLTLPSPADRARKTGSRPPPQPFPVDKLVRMILADTEEVWTDRFKPLDRVYEMPLLVLYTGSTPSGCGQADNRVSGPHYCEIDRRIYLDLEFFDELRARQAVAGDMSFYYVIGHEVGHHVQRLLGILDAASRVEKVLGSLGETAQRNALSVKVELQADCFAGFVAYHAHRLHQRLEADDVDLGLRTAAALGADRLQNLEQGVVQPESFTHGASEQRIRWFRRGLETGALHDCDPFNARDL
jgi:uncharacterized protein